MTPYEYARQIGLKASTIVDYLIEHGHLDPVGIGYYSTVLRTAMSAEAEAALRAVPRDTLAQLEGLSWNTAPELVTTAQAAELARTTPATIRQWVVRGKLQSVGRSGRSATYRRADVGRCSTEAHDAARSRYRKPWIDTSEIPEDTYLTIADVAKMSETTESTVRSWIRRGILPTSGKQGRRVLIRAYDVAGMRGYNRYDADDTPPSQR